MGVTVEGIELRCVEVHLVAVESVEIEGLVDVGAEVCADAHPRNELAVVVAELYHFGPFSKKGKLHVEFGIECRIVLARAIVEQHQHSAQLEALVGIVRQSGEGPEAEPGLAYLLCFGIRMKPEQKGSG